MAKRVSSAVESTFAIYCPGPGDSKERVEWKGAPTRIVLAWDERNKLLRAFWGGNAESVAEAWGEVATYEIAR